MSELTLVAVETARIQPYIFNSNRLRENVGASFLVAAATGDWALDCARQVAPDQHNVEGHRYNLKPIKPDQHIGEAGSTLDVEVLYAGGGNFVGLFRNDKLARDFASRLSQKVICEAPGLRITIHSAPFNWKDDPLCAAVGDVLGELREQRSRQPVSLGLGGLGVTAMCDSTSLPAVDYDPEDPDDGGIYSAETLAKRQVFKDANGYLRNQFELEDYYSFPADFDDLGRSEHERSYIAVVHADGNGMGEIITGIFSKIRDNKKYIGLMREFSERIKIIAHDVQRQMIRLLQQSIEQNNATGRAFLWGLNNQQPIELKPNDKDGGFYMPFRPLITGGDDITFVSDGRIGIALSALLLRTFEAETQLLMQWLREQLEQVPRIPDDLLSELPQRLTACAGIAIVKTHYPFARAYELTEELCSSAKTMMRQRKSQTGESHSILDWHFTAGGLYGPLEKMREREYLPRNTEKEVRKNGDVYTRIDKDWLTLRPVYLDINAHPYRTWSLIERLTTEFQVLWHEHRSKAKQLMRALREGPEQTELFELRYLQKSPVSLPDLADFSHGWQRLESIETTEAGKKIIVMGYCGYYDALELMDLYLPLETQEVAHG